MLHKDGVIEGQAFKVGETYSELTVTRDGVIMFKVSYILYDGNFNLILYIYIQCIYC